MTARILLSLAIIGVNLGGVAQAAEAPPGQVTLNIEAQPMEDALNQFAQQSGLQVLISSEDAPKGVRAPRVVGSFTADGALKQLLAESGLRYEFVNERTVAIRVEKTKGKDAKPVAAVARNRGDAWRLAQAESAQDVQEPAGSTADSSGAERAPPELEEVVVTGSHIRGTQNATIPLTVLDKAYIDSTGFSTTTRLMESLPQNFAFNNQSNVQVPGTERDRHQGSSVTLRGLGTGTTLILLNGRRLAQGYTSSAVDISALPLSAIERVEILTDGASALYGSDAVGGVVNFVLRRDFDGAETRLRVGSAPGGVDEYRVSQVLGNSWQSGNALLSLEYYRRDMLLSEDRDYVPSDSFVESLLPEDKNYSAVFAGRQELTDTVSTFADVLYSRRDSRNLSGGVIFGLIDLENPQASVAAGLDWQLAGDWRLNATGNYAKNKLDLTTPDAHLTSNFQVHGAQLKADGSIGRLPGGTVRSALGLEWRSESFRRDTVAFGAPGIVVDDDQVVRSAFAEVYVPLIGTDNAKAAARSLELSVAGRFDDYSKFGSSFDPQMGLMWEPIEGLRLRGSHGSSYKAPDLVTYGSQDNAVTAGFRSDPDAPGGRSYQMQVFGSDAASLKAQESTSSSFGIELKLPTLEGLRVAVNYYDIKYSDRIATPGDPSTILVNPQFFEGLVVREPSEQLVEAFIDFGHTGQGFFASDENFDPIPEEDFDPSTVAVLVDGRVRNLSEVRTNGFDLAASYGFDLQDNHVQLELAGTHISKFEQKLTAASPPFSTVDTLYNPPDWRVRSSVGWQRHGWAANLFLNHTDSYTDNRVPAAPRPIGSFTTVDAHLAYSFKERFSSGFLAGVTLSADVQNAFDRDPPRVAVFEDFPFFDVGFDPTNASPLRRLITLELTKSWGR